MLSWVDLPQSPDEIGPQIVEIALYPGRPPDHHMIRAYVAFHGNDLPGEFAETAFHTIANDCATDLLADSVPDALRWIAVTPIADEQDEAGCRRTPSSVSGKEVRAFPKGS